MHTLIETLPEFYKLDNLSKELASRLLSGISPDKVSQVIPANTDLFTTAEQTGCFFFIREGSFTYQLNGKKLFVLEDGDIAGLENIFPEISGSYTSDFAVIVDCYKKQDFFNACNSNTEKSKILVDYLQVQIGLLKGIVSSALKSEIELAPVFKNFSPGEIIIEQDSQAREVFTLVEGSAEAYVDGVKVGDIQRDEIFGMIAAFNGTPRTATVKATTRCMVLSVPLEKFIDLINSRPQTVLKLLEDMSRMIVGLNSKLVGLKG